MMDNYVLELLQNNKRTDGRGLDQYRDIEIKTDIIAKAEGSAYVRIGNTQVIAGVKMNIATPFADTPDEGVLMVNSEFTPLASPDFEAGPPSENAIELARIVDRGIRESKTVEMSKLVIVPGEKVWSVIIDIHIIDHQGNLQDAAALAAITALLNAKIPKLDENNTVLRGEFSGKLPVVHKPITVSVCKTGDKMFLDPSLDEESVIDSKLVLAFREDDKICAVQKQGSNGIEFDAVEGMIDMAMKKSKELRKLV